MCRCILERTAKFEVGCFWVWSIGEGNDLVLFVKRCSLPTFCTILLYALSPF